MSVGGPARPIRVVAEGEGFDGYVVHRSKTVWLAYCPDVKGKHVEATGGTEGGAISALKDAVARELDWP